MRWKEITEAPIADFGVYGDLDNEGSFRSQDVKAMNNPKWVEKVHRMFQRCPFDVNVYLYNAPEGKATLASNASREHTFRDLSTRARWMGVKPIMDIMKLTGKLPPKYQTSINVVLLQNEGDERIALTPWMVGHRIAHALTEPNTSDYDYELREATRDMISRSMSLLQAAARIIAQEPQTAEELEAVGSTNLVGKDDKINLSLCAPIFKFRSGKDHRIERPTEIVVEMITQYLSQGSITFNRPVLHGGPQYSEPKIARQDAGWYKLAMTDARQCYDGLQFKAFVKSYERDRGFREPKESWGVLDARGHGVAACGTEQRAKEIAAKNPAYRVFHDVPTPAKLAAYQRKLKRIEESDVLWARWTALGWLMPPEKRMSNSAQLDNLLTDYEERLTETCGKLLRGAVGKAIIF